MLKRPAWAIEASALRAKTSTDPEGLIEAARAALGPAIAARFAHEGTLRVIMIAPLLEQAMLEGMRSGDDGTHIVLDPSRVEQVVQSVKRSIAELDPAAGGEPVLVCAPSLRPAVRRLLSAQTDGLPVLSYNEATAGGIAIDTVGVVRDGQALAA